LWKPSQTKNAAFAIKAFELAGNSPLWDSVYYETQLWPVNLSSRAQRECRQSREDVERMCPAQSAKAALRKDDVCQGCLSAKVALCKE